MINDNTLAKTIKIVALVAVAIVVGSAVALGAAWLGHQFLVLTVGEEGIPAIDDTPLMLALVAGAYVAGGLSGPAVVTYGWMHFIRRRT